MKFPAIAAAAIFAASIFTSASVAQTANSGAAPSAVRPPADMLVDCAKAPKDAVTRLQPDLARWATVYCTKEGAIFNANETHFGAFPDSGKRASFFAGDMDGKKGAAGADSYFKSVVYAPVPAEVRDAIVKADPLSAKIFLDKPLMRLDLTTNNNNQLSFIAIDPAADPFWVFPLTEKGLGAPAFFVVSLAAMNRAR